MKLKITVDITVDVQTGKEGFMLVTDILQNNGLKYEVTKLKAM